jgi:erythritol kinase
MGHAPAEIRIAGGAARSRALRRILASVMGVPVRSVGRAESGAAGAGMIAAVQGGHYGDMDACAADWVTPLLGPPELPDAAAAELYAELFEVYRAVRIAMPPTWQRLAAIRRKSHASATGRCP